MSAQDWTPTPWVLSADGYSIIKGHGNQWVCVADLDDSQVEASEAISNASRIVAAINATKDMTTEGLELIASGGYEARLALLASLMLEEIKAKEKKANEEAETGEYPLTLGD